LSSDVISMIIRRSQASLR